MLLIRINPAHTKCCGDVAGGRCLHKTATAGLFSEPPAHQFGSCKVRLGKIAYLFPYKNLQYGVPHTLSGYGIKNAEKFSKMMTIFIFHFSSLARFVIVARD
jgi:hypothetical protein